MEYELNFDGDELELAVGQKVRFAGIATVRAIQGDVIDITSIGSDPQFTLGDVTVALVANRTSVERV
jgi:hypothetical protein